MIELRPKQQECVDKFRKIKSRLIGDSMGVGKTVEGIALDLALRSDYGKPGQHIRTLIICQKNGISVWNRHLMMFDIPEIDISCVNPLNREPFVQSVLLGEAKYYICHWDVLSKLEEACLRSVKWHHVIADEVHLAKNRKSLRTKSLKRIKAYVKTGCTGSFADDKPEDTWSILNWLYPSLYSSYWRFFNTFIDWEVGYPGGYKKPVGVKNIDKFHEDISRFYIHRTLHDVREDMPPKFYSTVHVELTSKQRKSYLQMEEFGVVQLGMGEDDILIAPITIAQRARLQQMAMGECTLDWDLYSRGKRDTPVVKIGSPSPKLDAIMELITTNEQESFVVFTSYPDFADMVERACSSKGILSSKITGRTDKQSHRTKAVSDFQSGVTRVFVGTIGAAGTTITLNSAHTVIFADRDWNPSKNAQAEDRAYRIDNDDQPVHIIDIVAKDTIDEYRIEKVQLKGKWVYIMKTPPKQGTVSVNA